MTSAHMEMFPPYCTRTTKVMARDETSVNPLRIMILCRYHETDLQQVSLAPSSGRL